MTRDELRAFLAPLPDEAILALTLFGEARGEPIEGIISVGCVVRNRAHDAKQRWGTTYRAVCLQKAQFSCWQPSGGEQNHQAVIDAASVLLTKQPAPPLLEQCAWVSLGIAKGAVLDTVKGSNHYHVATMNPRPDWAVKFVPTCQRGHHVFYKL